MPEPDLSPDSSNNRYSPAIVNANRLTNMVGPIAIAIVAIVIFFLVHPVQKFFFVPAMILALVCYFQTSYRKMPKPERVLPLYLLALAIQFLHFTEEYIYGFHVRVTEILEGTPPFSANIFVAFNMIAYCLFLLSGLVCIKG